MKKFSFLHISDLHLCEPFKNNFYLDGYFLREEMWKTLQNAVIFANNKNIEFIFITGDIFNKEYFTKAHALRFIEILKNFRGEKIFIIFGNHDFVGGDNVLLDVDIPENIIVNFSNEIDEFVMPEYNLSIFMHSWTNAVERVPVIDAIKFKSKRNILLLHSGTNVDPGYMPVAISSLTRFDYVALGHIHKPTTVSKNICYPGSLTPLSIGETGAHGGMYGLIDESLKLEFVRLSELQYTNAEIDVDGLSYDDIVEILKIEGGINILRLKIKGSKNIYINVDDLKASLSNFYKFVEIVDERIYTEEFMKEHSEIFEGIVRFLDKKNLDDNLRREVIESAIKHLVGTR